METRKIKKRPPVIFLDIDGVLCTARAHKAFATQSFMQHLDPVGVRMLDKLCHETKALLVLSSTWRCHHDHMSMSAILMNAGFGNVPWHQNWKTPELNGVQRGIEIQSWLNSNGNPHYVIIDDDRDMLDDQQPFFVQTHMDDGFLYEHYRKAKRILCRTGSSE